MSIWAVLRYGISRSVRGSLRTSRSTTGPLSFLVTSILSTPRSTKSGVPIGRPMSRVRSATRWVKCVPRHRVYLWSPSNTNSGRLEIVSEISRLSMAPVSAGANAIHAPWDDRTSGICAVSSQFPLNKSQERNRPERVVTALHLSDTNYSRRASFPVQSWTWYI